MLKQIDNKFGSPVQRDFFLPLLSLKLRLHLQNTVWLNCRFDFQRWVLLLAEKSKPYFWYLKPALLSQYEKSGWDSIADKVKKQRICVIFPFNAWLHERKHNHLFIKADPSLEGLGFYFGRALSLCCGRERLSTVLPFYLARPQTPSHKGLVKR